MRIKDLIDQLNAIPEENKNEDIMFQLNSGEFVEISDWLDRNTGKHEYFDKLYPDQYFLRELI
jgi:hypothetical protein